MFLHDIQKYKMYRSWTNQVIVTRVRWKMTGNMLCHGRHFHFPFALAHKDTKWAQKSMATILKSSNSKSKHHELETGERWRAGNSISRGGAACLVINERRAGGPAISLEGGGIKFSKHIMVTRNAEWPENITPPSHFSLLPEPPQAWPLSLRLGGAVWWFGLYSPYAALKWFWKKGINWIDRLHYEVFVNVLFFKGFFSFWKCIVFFNFLEFNFDINTLKNDIKY